MNLRNILVKLKLNLLRALKVRVSRKSLEKMYFAYIRPLLEYSDVVWNNCCLESKKLLDAVHVEATRNVTGATKMCSTDRLFMELGWESLQLGEISINLPPSTKLCMT